MTTPPPPGDYSTGQVPLRGTRPKEVEISFWLWIATLVLGVVGAVAAYSQINQIRANTIDRALAQNPAANQSMIERAATAGFVVGVVLVLLIVAAELVFVFLMRGGRNWARIVLAVLGGLGVLFGLIGLAIGGGSVTGLLQLLLLIGAIVTMFLPSANAWFQPRSPGF
ncbi:MAG TPA: hypothetical protein VN327_04445 [Pseudonocardiaceae bacterium]|nr:hypothetical protein [Pseudonocardiaceae bacterium]